MRSAHEIWEAILKLLYPYAAMAAAISGVNYGSEMNEKMFIFFQRPGLEPGPIPKMAQLSTIRRCISLEIATTVHAMQNSHCQWLGKLP